MIDLQEELKESARTAIQSGATRALSLYPNAPQLRIWLEEILINEVDYLEEVTPKPHARLH